MVRDTELPFIYYTKMSRCQLRFLLYLLLKQDGDFKPKWWPNNVRFEQPISNLCDITKYTLINLLNSYYKIKGDSDWLRAVIFFAANLDNLTNETDFTSIDISGKISHKGVKFDIIPSLKSVKMEFVNRRVHNNNKHRFSILNKSNLNAVAHLNGTKLKDKKMFDTNSDYTIDLTNDKDVKLCIKESHIKQMMPAASVQLYDVVKYNKLHSQEDFLLTLNLMKTDVLSKLNLLKFRKRLRNNSRDCVRSASEFEKDLIKFRSKPNKETLKQSKQKKKNKKLQKKIKEKDKVESSNTITENMVVDNLPQLINVNENDTDINKENKNSFKENITTTVNSISSTKIPLQPKNKIKKKTDLESDSDSVIIDLTLEETPSKVSKEPNNLYQFLNMAPIISPARKTEIKIKQSSPKNLKRLKRQSLPPMNQKDIKSYFNPIPMKLSPKLVVKKLELLKSVCRPCFVKLDLVKDLKPIRSITKELDEIKTKVRTLPLPIVMEEVTTIIDLTDNTDIFESISNKLEVKSNEIPENKNKNIKDNYLELSMRGIKDKVKNKPKNIIKKKKVIIKVKWPSKRITL